MATLIRTYFKYARWRRSLRRFAAPACAALSAAHVKSSLGRSRKKKKETFEWKLEPVVVVVVSDTT